MTRSPRRMARRLGSAIQDHTPRTLESTARWLTSYTRSQLSTTRLDIDTRATSLPVGEVVDWFDTSDGERLPILEGYRSRLKPWWRFYQPVDSLLRARDQGLLLPAEQTLLDQGIGDRTFTVPLDRFADALGDVRSRHSSHFVGDHAASRWLPDEAEIRESVQEMVPGLARLFGSVGRPLRSLRGQSVLDVGCGAAGYSLLMFEQLGARRVVGIDSSYGTSQGTSEFTSAVRSRIDTSTEYLACDMADGPERLGKEQFDLSTSLSVLEHVLDLDGFFRGLLAVMRPGGVGIHRFEQYATLRGGHSPGIMDQPWGHLLLEGQDRADYLERFRPHELTTALDWFEHSLNFATAFEVVDSAREAGFEIEHLVVDARPEWSATPYDLELLLRAAERNAGIGTVDPFTRAVTIVIRRP